jgi:hypothetical protein
LAAVRVSGAILARFFFGVLDGFLSFGYPHVETVEFVILRLPIRAEISDNSFESLHSLLEIEQSRGLPGLVCFWFRAVE